MAPLRRLRCARVSSLLSPVEMRGFHGILFDRALVE
jgi:hypothetical protein